MATLTLGIDQKAAIAAKKAFDEEYHYTLSLGLEKPSAYELAKIAGLKAYEKHLVLADL
jgi:hypothetical protein